MDTGRGNSKKMSHGHNTQVTLQNFIGSFSVMKT